MKSGRIWYATLFQSFCCEFCQVFGVIAIRVGTFGSVQRVGSGGKVAEVIRNRRCTRLA